MTVIPAAHRFTRDKQRETLKLAFKRSIEREERKPDPPEAA